MLGPSHSTLTIQQSKQAISLPQDNRKSCLQTKGKPLLKSHQCSHSVCAHAHGWNSK